jgi:hypothetical protein
MHYIIQINSLTEQYWMNFNLKIINGNERTIDVYMICVYRKKSIFNIYKSIKCCIT